MRIATLITYLFSAFILLGIGACGSSKKLEAPEEYYNTGEENPLSKVNIPIRLDIKAMEASLNEQLSGTLYEDNDISDDNLMLRAVKEGDIRLRIDSQQIKYQIPLLLWIKYDAGITDLEANGELMLDMTTEFEVMPSWRIETKTDLVNYEWLREPKLRMGVMSMSVGSLMDIVLRNGRQFLTQEIDRLVSESFNLQDMISDVWKQMYEPMLVSEEYNTWMVVNPERLAITPLRAENEDFATSVIVVESRPYVKLGQRPELFGMPPLPPLEIIPESGKDFFLLIDTEITYKEAERLAQEQMLGETFESGKRSVTVEDIEIYGSGNKLVINTLLSGSYEGHVYLEGEPVFNVRKNTVEIKNLNYTLKTANFLYKSAGWLLRSTIKNKFEKNMEFLLDYNLDEMKKQVQEQLKGYEVADGINLEGNLEHLGIMEVRLTETAMRVDIGMMGDIVLKVQGIGK